MTSNLGDRTRDGWTPGLVDTNGNRAAVPYLTGYTDSKFRDMMREAKRYIDSSNIPEARHFKMYAGNEWHGGGVLEPNIRDGAVRLKILNEALFLKRGIDPCQLSGKCFPYGIPPVIPSRGAPPAQNGERGLEWSTIILF